jgi:hypothetical protein
VRGVRVVWTAVFSAASGVAAVVAGALEGQLAVALGAISISAAILAARER